MAMLPPSPPRPTFLPKHLGYRNRVLIKGSQGLQAACGRLCAQFRPESGLSAAPDGSCRCLVPGPLGPAAAVTLPLGLLRLQAGKGLAGSSTRARPPQAPEPEMLQDTMDVTFPPDLTRRLTAEMQAHGNIVQNCPQAVCVRCVRNPRSPVPRVLGTSKVPASENTAGPKHFAQGILGIYPHFSD